MAAKGLVGIRVQLEGGGESTGSEAHGERQIDNETPSEFSDDWSDGHFE